MNAVQKAQEREFIRIAKHDARRFRELERVFVDRNAKFPQFAQGFWPTEINRILDERADEIVIAKERIERVKKQHDPALSCARIDECQQIGEANTDEDIDIE